MQLFSIGLVELNADGTAAAVDGKRASRPTRRPTSPAWPRCSPAGAGPARTWPDNSCFFNGAANGMSDPDRSVKPMVGYPQYHSTEEKTFLGTTIAAQDHADPDGQPEGRARHAGEPPERRPVHRPPADPAPGDQQPQPAYVAAVGAALQQRRRRARRHGRRREGDPDGPRGAHASATARASCASRCCGCRPSCAPSPSSRTAAAPDRRHRQRRALAGPDAAALAVGVQLLPARLCAAGHRVRGAPAWRRRKCRSPTRPRPPAT